MASKNKKPAEMSEEDLKDRLEKTARWPQFVEKHENLISYGGAAILVGLTLLVSNIVTGPGLVIAGCLGMAALGVGATAALGLKWWRWKDEHDTLSAEDKNRAPARAAEKKALAVRLKEAFVSAFTRGTTKEIDVKKPLQLRKPHGAHGPNSP